MTVMKARRLELQPSKQAPALWLTVAAAVTVAAAAV